MGKNWKQGLKINSISCNNLTKYLEKGEELYCSKIMMPPSLLLKHLVEKGIGEKDIVQIKYDYDLFEEYTEGDEKKVRRTKKKSALRKDGYISGFAIDWGKEKIIYKNFFRSVSKSKKGEVLFINEKFYNEAVEWQTMGLCNMIKEGEKCKLVELEAYKSLTASGIVPDNLIKIKPSEMLILEDLKSSYVKKVALVQTNEKKECYVSEVERKITNVLFDGQALADDSLFKAESENGMMVLRNHFFKACAFRTDIQAFMRDWCNENGKDYNTFQVKDMFGSKKYVKNIKLITTNNAIKWIKFSDLFNSVEEAKDYWLKKICEDDYYFGVVKTDHSSRFGKYQRLSYQMINSMPLKEEEIIELAQYEIEKVKQLKDNDEFFIQYLKDNSKEESQDLNGYKMLLDLIIQKGMINSDYVNRRRTHIISEYVTNLKKGKIEVTGDNLTVVQNPIEMLYHAVEVLDTENPVAVEFGNSDEYVEVSTEHFDYDVELGAFRNPHNAPNNIIAYKNVKCPLITKYCKLGKNIIAVNGIKTDTEDRCNSMDMDGDFQLVTDNEIIVRKAKECYKNYLTIVNGIQEEDCNKYKYTEKDKAKIDNKLAKSQANIGKSSNYAQVAQSLYWDELSKETPDMKKAEELKEYFIILSVLAQVQIDSAKRSYKVSDNEIEKIAEHINSLYLDYSVIFEYENSQKESKTITKCFVYPEFFKYLCEKKEYIIMDDLTEEDKKKNPRNWNKFIKKNIKCPMNYLIKQLNTIPKATRKTIKPFYSFYSDEVNKQDNGKVNRRIVNKFRMVSKEYVESIIKETTQKDVDKLTLGLKVNEATRSVKSIRKNSMNNATIIELIEMGMRKERIKYIEDTQIKTTIIKILYQYHKDQFLSMFKDVPIPKMT